MDGPAQPGHVVHVGRDAIYVQVGRWCLGVLARAAHQVPNGVRTTAPSLSGLLAPGAGPGDPASVGDGAITLGSLRVHVARVVDAGVPAPLPPGSRRAVAEALAGPPDPVAERLDAARAELPRAALADLAAGEEAAVPALIGRGSGLTPLGDDVLAGWLATRVALGTPEPALAARATDTAPTATTALSATLLDCAVHGEVLPEFRTLLCAPTSEAARAALARLVRVGHTSGAGHALGAALSLDTALDTAPSTVPHAPAQEGRTA